MSTYIIGDIQGCLDQLKNLLKKIRFNQDRDRLGFVGDLVNRGPKSLETLRFIKSLDDPIIVLGNHDLHLLALYHGAISRPSNHDLTECLHAHDSKQLIDWLQTHPLAHYEPSFNTLIVHAGTPPQWNLQETLAYAEEVSQQLVNDKACDFLSHMYGNEPSQWSSDLSGWDRLRYITNALTRMRFCRKSGELSLENTTNNPDDPGEKPWFSWIQPDYQIVFGHWAALNGHSTNPKCIATDTGCVWSGTLSAYELETQTFHRVPGITK